ncbi:MAG: hypothetical protein PUC00_09800 [Clostridiales bacterium]|nr:hypothetical protein [Clostridiales bacterium]
MKKLLSLLLALTMLLPLLAFAEGDPTVGVIGGADGPTSIFVGGPKLPSVLTSEAVASGRQVISNVKVTELSGLGIEGEDVEKIVADILDALTLQVTQQGDEGSLNVLLGDKNVLTLGAALSGQDLYLSSQLLGGTIVVNMEEIEPLITRLLQTLVNMGAMTAEDAQEMIDQIGMVQQTLATAMEQPAQMMNLMAELENIDFTALEPISVLIESKLTVLETPTVPRMCDPAAMAMQARFTNEDMVQGSMTLCQFLLDNPVLMNLFGQLLGVPTQAQMDETWALYGETLVASGMTEEDFRAQVQTIDAVLAEAMEQLKTKKIIDGEYVLTVCMDEAGMPVYIAAEVPYVVTEEVPAQTDEVGLVNEVETVVNIAVTYTRQTLADGVQHTCNITVDGDTLSFALLAKEDSFILTMDEIAQDGTVEKLMDLTVQVKPAAAENAPDALTAEMNLYDGDEIAMMKLVLDAECIFTDVRTYLAGKLTITQPGATDYITLAVNSDYAITGVDFVGKTSVTLDVDLEGEKAHMVLVEDSFTADPVDSIMAGQVTRPAELDDEAFSQWFVNVMLGLNTWQAEALNALPDSVKVLLMPAAE